MGSEESLSVRVARALGLTLRQRDDGEWQAKGSGAVPWYSIPDYVSDGNFILRVIFEHELFIGRRRRAGGIWWVVRDNDHRVVMCRRTLGEAVLEWLCAAHAAGVEVKL